MRARKEGEERMIFLEFKNIFYIINIILLLCQNSILSFSVLILTEFY